jgi:hypothetical protein
MAFGRSRIASFFEVLGVETAEWWIGREGMILGGEESLNQVMGSLCIESKHHQRVLMIIAMSFTGR